MKTCFKIEYVVVKFLNIKYSYSKYFALPLPLCYIKHKLCLMDIG